MRASQERGDKARVAIVDLDPQKSLAEWWKPRGRIRRNEDDSPRIFTGVHEAADAVERAELAGYDWCFLDGPPAFLTAIEEMIAAADFTVIPIKPSTVDLLATEDAIVLARKSGKPFLCVPRTCAHPVGTTGVAVAYSEQIGLAPRAQTFEGELRSVLPERIIIIVALARRRLLVRPRGIRSARARGTAAS